jgi:proto-oncogene serine/threonine-protein kinase Pim-3
MDLFDVISVYGRLDESTARGVFRQVLATVMGLKRKQSIVHRDIKDENIIVDMDSGRIMLIDFGAAEIFDHLKAQRFQGSSLFSLVTPKMCSLKCITQNS